MSSWNNNHNPQSNWEVDQWNRQPHISASYSTEVQPGSSNRDWQPLGIECLTSEPDDSLPNLNDSLDNLNDVLRIVQAISSPTPQLEQASLDALDDVEEFIKENPAKCDQGLDTLKTDTTETLKKSIVKPANVISANNQVENSNSGKILCAKEVEPRSNVTPSSVDTSFVIKEHTEVKIIDQNTNSVKILDVKEVEPKLNTTPIDIETSFTVKEHTEVKVVDQNTKLGDPTEGTMDQDQNKSMELISEPATGDTFTVEPFQQCNSDVEKADDEAMLVPSLVDQLPENVSNSKPESVEDNTVDEADVCKDLLPEVTSGNQEPAEECGHRSVEKSSGTDEEVDKPEDMQCGHSEDTETADLVTEMEVDEPEKTTTGSNDPEEHEHSKLDQGSATENASTVDQSKPPENNVSYDMVVADHSLVENEIQENAEEHEHSKLDQGPVTENESMSVNSATSGTDSEEGDLNEELFVATNTSAARSKKLTRIKARNAPSIKPYKAFVFEPVELTPELEKRYGDLLTITIQTPDEDVVDVISTILSTIEDGELHEAKQAAMLKKAKEEQHVPPLTSSKVQLSPKIAEKYGNIIMTSPSITLKRIPVSCTWSMNIVGSVQIAPNSRGSPTSQVDVDATKHSPSEAGIPRCPKCRKTMLAWKSLHPHLVNIHGMEFDAAKKLISVARNTPHKLPVDCTVCGTTYYNNYKARHHMMQKHGIAEKKAVAMLLNDGAYSESVCPKCENSMSSAINLRRHLVFSHDISCLEAVRCMKNTPAIPAANLAPNACPKCKRVMADQAMLRRHLKFRHNTTMNLMHNTKKADSRGNQNNACPQCKRPFLQKYNLRRHLINVHKMAVEEIHKLGHFTTGGSSSDVSGEADSKSDLKEIIKTNNHSKETVFVCQKCPKTYEKFHSLCRHLIENHGYEKDVSRRFCEEQYPQMYTCDDCTRFYRFSGQLKNHLIKGHSYSKKDADRICALRCKAANAKEANHDTKKQQCPKCKKCFSSVKEKYKHMANDHKTTGNKALDCVKKKVHGECPKCGKIFDKCPSNLRRHMIRVHKISTEKADKFMAIIRKARETEQPDGSKYKNPALCAPSNVSKPGQCPKCGKVFEANPFNLKKHLIQVHKISTEKAVQIMAKLRKVSITEQPNITEYNSEAKQSKDHTQPKVAKSSPCCYRCNMNFVTNATLKRHLINIHSMSKSKAIKYMSVHYAGQIAPKPADVTKLHDVDAPIHLSDDADNDHSSDLPRMPAKGKFQPHNVSERIGSGKKAIAISTDKKKIHQLSSKRKVEVSRKNPTCPDCNKRFLKIKILEVHYRKRHKQRQMPHMCRHCQKGYFTAPGLEMHMVQFHEDSDDDEITQESVSRKADDDDDDEDDDDDLSSEEDISARHMKKMSRACVKSTKTSFSMKTKPQKHIFRCMQCPKAFYDKSIFQKHKYEAHKVSSVVLEAKQNTDLLKSMTDAQRQKYEALLDEVAGSPTEPMETSMILLCPDCDKYFHKKSDLENHRRREHEGNVPVTDSAHSSYASSVSDEPAEPVIKQTTTKSGCNCPCCGKKYLKNSGLATHMRFTHPSYKASAGIGQKTSATSADRRGSHDSGRKITAKTSAEPSIQNTGSTVDENSTSCFICEHKTQTIAGLELHIRDKHGQDKLPYNCSICSKGFLNPHRVTRHANWVHKTKTSAEPSIQNTGSKVDENSTSCFICEHKTQTINGLEQHIKDKHGHDKLPYRCGICSKSFLKPERVTGHAQMVHKTNVNVVQKQTSALKNEDSGSNDGPKSAKNVVGEVIKKGDKFACPECDKTYQEIRTVESHVLAHHKDKILPYQCQFCVNSYIVENRMHKHMVKCHMERLREEPESSSTKKSRLSMESKGSSKRESNKTGKYRNLFVGDGERGSSHYVIEHVGVTTCPDCDKTCINRKAMEIHYRACHSELTMPFQCRICVRGYFEQSALDIHYSRSHKGITDSSVCSKNGSQKRRSSTPITHESQKKPKTHDKYHQCPSCKVFYSTSGEMENHFRAKHPKDRMPYSCTTCLRGYFDLGRLKLHCSHAHGINLSLDDLQLVKYKSDTKIEVDNSDGEDSHSSEKESYTSVLTQSDKGPAKSTANGDDDADSYTSDQDELNQPIDTLRDDLITKILHQPSLLGGTSISSHTSVAQNPPITSRQQLTNKVFPPSQQAPLGNVIVIAPTTNPIPNQAIAAEARADLSQADRGISLDKQSFQDEELVDANNVRHYQNIMPASDSLPCPHCGKMTKKSLLDHHIEVYHAPMRVIYLCPICSLYSAFQRVSVRRHMKKMHPTIATGGDMESIMASVPTRDVPNPDLMNPGTRYAMQAAASTPMQVSRSGQSTEDRDGAGGSGSGLLNAMFQSIESST